MSNSHVRRYYWSLVFLFVPGAQLLTPHHIPCISADSVCSVIRLRFSVEVSIPKCFPTNIFECEIVREFGGQSMTRVGRLKLIFLVQGSKALSFLCLKCSSLAVFNFTFTLAIKSLLLWVLACFKWVFLDCSNHFFVRVLFFLNQFFLRNGKRKKLENSTLRITQISCILF